MDWNGRRAAVFGGASFIGSHIVDLLVSKGAKVEVVDDLSSGKLSNLVDHISKGAITFYRADLNDPMRALAAAAGHEFVFHLAAKHGGRGYVDTHQYDCAQNLKLDGIVFDACQKTGVSKVIYASSGCVYPNYIQNNPAEELYLTEDKVGPPYDADNMYGWAKLMAEMTLRAYYKDKGMKSACCRYFTVYGPRGKEDHAVIAMIARSFLRQDPFEVWGDGTQVRNWTYVTDIAEGTVLAAECIEDGSAVNLGTMERITVLDAIDHILHYKVSGYRPTLKFLKDKPTGPKNRVADNKLAKKLLGWEPKVDFVTGLHKTIGWYYTDRTEPEARKALLFPMER